MKHINLLFGSILFLLISVVPLASVAAVAEKAEAVASVSLIQGDVHAISPDGDKRQLTQGAPVYAGERVKTGEGGAVVLVFLDGTVWELLDDHSEFKISSYQFSVTPSSAGKDRAKYEVVAGPLRYSSGEMGERGEGNITIDFQGQELIPLGTKIMFTLNESGQLAMIVLEGAVQIGRNTVSQGTRRSAVQIIGQGQAVLIGTTGGAAPISIAQISQILGPRAAAAIANLIEQGEGASGVLNIRDNLRIRIPPQATSPSSPNTR